MLRYLFYALTYWAPVLLILLLVFARIAAPSFPYRVVDSREPIAESLFSAAKERSDSGYLYVKVDDGDPSAEILADLNGRKLPATFAPLSDRPQSHSVCPPRTLCNVIDGLALRDNVISAELLAMPLWHIALVRIKAGACSAELTLVQATRWHVLSQRTACK